MPSSPQIPSPDNDYAAPAGMSLGRAQWDAVFASVGARLRELEAKGATWDELIAVGTSQALASIAANVAPHLQEVNTQVAALQVSVAEAQDIIADINAGIIPATAIAETAARIWLSPALRDGWSSAIAALETWQAAPTVPTATLGTNSTAAASTAFVQAAIAALINAAPGTLDTLDELAAALGDDANFAATVSGALAQRLRVDAAQGLTDAQKGQARANIGVGGKASTRNRHLNPAFQVCQDRALGATVVLSAPGYAMDGVYVWAAGGGALTCSQVAKPTPGGSPYRFRATVSTADTSINAADAYTISFPIEGVDIADLKFGTSGAQSFVWRAVVNFPLGTYGLTFRNASAARSYVTTITISSAQSGVDTIVTATVPGDVAGAWISDASGVGIRAEISIAQGSSGRTTTLNQWQAGSFVAGPTQNNGMVSTGVVYEIADIGLYAGTEIPAWELPALAHEELRCQRYYANPRVVYSKDGGTGRVSGLWRVPMRATPALTVSAGVVDDWDANGWTGYSTTSPILQITTANARL